MVPMLVVSSAERLCALPVADVIETMRPLPIEPLADAPAYVSGVAVIRGAAVPVVDLGRLTGSAAGACTRFVSLRVDARRVALAVDAVLGVRRLSSARVADLPRLLDPARNSALQALGELDGRLLLVLAGTRLVPEAVWSAVAGADQHPT